MIFWKPNETPEERRRREQYEAEMSYVKRLYEQAKNGDRAKRATGGGSAGGAAAGVGASSGPIAGATVKAYLADGTVKTAKTDANGNTSLEGDFVKIVATGGIDQITGEENKMVLEARGDVRQCTPVNTIASYCFDIVESKMKLVNEERKGKGSEELAIPTVEYIYNNILHPENVEAAFGVSTPADVYGTDSASAKYYEEDSLPSKTLAILNAACGENIKYAARTIKEIYSLAHESKNEAETLDHVYKMLAIRWYERTGQNMVEDWLKNMEEGTDHDVFEANAFGNPRELPEQFNLADYGKMIETASGPLEVLPEFDSLNLKTYTELDKEGNPTPIDIVIRQKLEDKGAAGLEKLWKDSKASRGGNQYSIGKISYQFMKEMLLDNDDTISDPRDRDTTYTAGPSVTVRSSKYINTNIIGIKQTFKESFDAIKSKYYSKSSDFDAKFNVKHKGQTLAKKTWQKDGEIDKDLLNESENILVIIPGVLGIQRSNNGSEREFWNPFYNTEHDSSTGILGTAWFNGTVTELFEGELETRIDMYEKAIRQTQSTHSDHTAIDEDFAPVSAKKVLGDGMNETVTMYSGWNDTFYQAKFIFGKEGLLDVEIESFEGNVFRQPDEIESIENIRLGISRPAHSEKAAKNARHNYREVWRKKSKRAKNLSKMKKYEDIRSSVERDEDLWREAADSIITLPPVETQSSADGRLEGGLLEYDNVEISRGLPGQPSSRTKNRVLAIDLDTSHFEENNSHHYVHNMYIFPGDIKNGVNAESDVLRGDAVIGKRTVISYQECNNDLSRVRPWKKFPPEGGK